jgi:hypothetical protein
VYILTSETIVVKSAAKVVLIFNPANIWRKKVAQATFFSTPRATFSSPWLTEYFAVSGEEVGGGVEEVAVVGEDDVVMSDGGKGDDLVGKVDLGGN